MVNLGALSLKIRDEHSKRRGWNFSAWIQNFIAHIILVNNNLNKRFSEKNIRIPVQKLIFSLTKAMKNIAQIGYMLTCFGESRVGKFRNGLLGPPPNDMSGRCPADI